MFDPNREPQQKSRLEKIEFTAEENVLIELIKEKGSENKEFVKKFLNWTGVWQKKVEKAKNDNLAQINFLRRRAYLYLKVGFLQEAGGYFDVAIELAYQMSNIIEHKINWEAVKHELAEEAEKVTENL